MSGVSGDPIKPTANGTGTAGRFDELFGGRPLVAILRGLAPAEAVRLAHAVWDTGLGVVEVPVQTSAAVASLRAVVAAAADRGECCGAGTVISTQQVAVAAGVGAAFTVAPGLDLEVAHASVAAGLPHLPGAASATEVQAVLRAGFDWIKMFPAGALGASWLREMRGPFPHVRFVATGGVSPANVTQFVMAGAVALGVGSAVTAPGGLDEFVRVLRSPGR